MGMTSNRGLARQLGVSETAVRRAETAGRIKREADGAWDPARIKAAWAIDTDQAQQRPARSGSRTDKHRTMKPVPEAALGAVRETVREHGEPVSAGGMTFMQARTANEVLKAQERRLRLQQMKGELVDRAKAVAQVRRSQAGAAAWSCCAIWFMGEIHALAFGRRVSFRSPRRRKRIQITRPAPLRPVVVAQCLVRNHRGPAGDLTAGSSGKFTASLDRGLRAGDRRRRVAAEP
jgi:hypothetical protein